ncbi:MAG: DUF4290 domain-containing protein [Bacteroidota bacterium]
MEYNSQKDHLVISEYGRNVQNMIYTVRKEEDPEKRQRMADALIELMHQMNPADRNNPDYKEKLWRHLFRIADYDIDVTPPDGTKPTPESNSINPLKIEYPANLRKNRHYGRMVQELITKAIEMEDGEKKDEFIMIIASYMKVAYRTWNREHFVSDDVIKQDLENISGGKLKLAEEDVIEVSIPLPRNTNNNRKSGGRNNRNNNRRKNNNNRRRR